MRNTDSLKNNFEFRRLYRSGKNAVCPHLAIYFRKTRENNNRLGITVSTKVGNAVVRNKVRRRIREAYCIHEGEFISPVDLIIVARVKAANADFHKIESAMLQLSEKLGLLKGASE